MNKKASKNDKGITIVALVVTIIILLILAGVTLSMLLGDGGIITQAQTADMVTELKQVQEKVDIAIMEEKLKAKNNSTEFNINNYKKLNDFNPEIKSKYSEYIGIDNGKIFVSAGAEDTLKSAAQSIGIYVAISATNEGNEITLEELETASIKNYGIYGNSIQNGTPTPETPIEIESVGDKTDNLFDIKAATSNTPDNIYWGDELDKEKRYTLRIRLKEGKSLPSASFGFVYRYSDNTVSNAIWFLQDGVLIREISASHNSTYEWLSVACYPANQTTWDTILDAFEISLYEGYYTESNIPAYEPHGYRIPVTVSGKNLFNKENAILGKNLDANSGGLYTSSARCVSDYIEVDYTKSYTFKYNAGGTATRYVLCYDKDKNYITGAHIRTAGDAINYMTIAFNNSEVKFIRANCYWKEDGSDSEIDEFMIYEGSGNDAFEPYVEPVTTNIYLNEPLRKIGDYKDYIDFEKGKVFRNINKLVLNGSEDWKYYGSRTNLYYIRLEDCMLGYQMSICNRFENKDGIWIANSPIGVYTDHTSMKYKYFATPNENINDITSFKEWLNSNITELCYVLETPDDTENIELPNIPTYKGTNTITVGTEIAPSKIEIEH